MGRVVSAYAERLAVGIRCDDIGSRLKRGAGRFGVGRRGGQQQRQREKNGNETKQEGLHFELPTADEQLAQAALLTAKEMTPILRE